MVVGWVHDRFFHRHRTDETHPERADRLEVIVSDLAAAGVLDRMRPLQFQPASAEIVGWIHEPAYVDLVRLACEQGFGFIGSSDTKISPESYDAALLAVGGVLAACDAAMSGEVPRSFCAVRPPGHHAERDLAMGYCLFNNVAIAAEYLIRRHGLKRVAILDWDVHHGNGIQHIFEERRDVFYVSIHQMPQSLFPGTGYEHEIGHGPGEGFTLNIPMKPGSGDREYHGVFDTQVFPRLDEYAPEFVLLSTGFDATRGDPIASLNLEPSSYGWMTREIAEIAKWHSHGRIVSVLEGGYDRVRLGQCAIEHITAMMDEVTDADAER
ncbi:MAG: histone deacetylase [Planctomycetes bacterium]|nr:histone deacetylase [Planctomycetota bacterium]